jgi:Skp family chaperone for outer membrane proteins
MKRLGYTFLLVAMPFLLLSGCASTQESAEPTAVLHMTDSAREAQPELKVGVIDLLEVMKRSRVGQPALAAWRLEEEKLSEEVSAENRMLEDLGKRAARSGGMEWQQYVNEFNRYRVKYFQRLAKTSNISRSSYTRAVATILPQVSKATTVIAEAGGFTAVLNKGTTETIIITFYAGKVFDLTDQIIEELDRQFP